MMGWKGQKFFGQVPIRNLHSVSANWGWGGVDITTGNHVQDYWRDKSGLHINIKELQVAVDTVKSLAHPGENVTLCVDNSVAFSYLMKGGGRFPHFNAIM